MSAVLAIDQGTTGSTALVLSEQGEVLGRAYSEFTQHYPKPGWVEHDAEEIWRVSLRVMAAALADSGLSRDGLVAIGITNQRETTVIWDRKTGKPVHRAIVWQSRQSAPVCERMRAEGHEPLFRERTGLVMDPYFSGTKIRWILDRDPELQRRAERGREVHPLHFAAAQGAGLAVQVEVAEPNLTEVPQPTTDLLQHGRRGLVNRSRQGEIGKEVQEI